MGEPTLNELQIKIESLKELIETGLKARDKALEVQSAEYARRLDALNHAHEQAVEVQRTYVEATLYSSQHKDVIDRVARLEKDTASNGRVDKLEDTFRDKADVLAASTRDSLTKTEQSHRERVDAYEKAGVQRYTSLSRI